MTDTCPIRHELRREYDIMWRRIDEHGTHIVDLKSIVSELKANGDAANLRYERLLVSLAETRGEDRHSREAMSKNIESLCAAVIRIEQAEATRKEESEKAFKKWAKWIGIGGFVVTVLALTGNSEAALPPPQSCAKCNPIPIFVEESM